MTHRIHITGASGAGVTTVGRGLAAALGIPHHDTDDYFWLPTEPPYRDKRPEEDRLRLMRQMFLPRAAWVLSGSLSGWGDPLIPHFDTVIFVYAPTELRLQRIRDREARRYGTADWSPDNPTSAAFLEWAAKYDTAGLEMRSLARHEAWLATLDCPIIRLDGSGLGDRLVAEAIAALP